MTDVRSKRGQFIFVQNHYIKTSIKPFIGCRQTGYYRLHDSSYGLFTPPHTTGFFRLSVSCWNVTIPLEAQLISKPGRRLFLRRRHAASVRHDVFLSITAHQFHSTPKRRAIEFDCSSVSIWGFIPRVNIVRRAVSSSSSIA